MLDLCETILKYLDQFGKIDTLTLSKQLNIDHQRIIGALKSIQTHGNLIEAEQKNEKHLEITNEGQLIIDNGCSYEANIYNSIPIDGVEQSELMKLPNAKIGVSKAISSGWIYIEKTPTNQTIVKRKLSKIIDTVYANLKMIQLGYGDHIEESVRQEYRKRKLIQEIVVKSFELAKGPEFAINLTKLETDLTADMLVANNWQNLNFKSYNFDALGIEPECGYLHPLLKVRSEFRQIFLEMGFTEMPTNNYIENSFWNFDALYQPQQHPARDAHDTFFVSEPRISTEFPCDYLEKVKKIHSEGGYGSVGYRYDWRIEEAQKNLLRTHTTAVSARMLYKLAQNKFEPIKLFSIDKVFRNETLDATHLAEFCQVEGVIADYNITLGDLIGVLTEFFKKIGITQLEFKPAYNPYTEPSMEMFCYHNGLNRWIEIGNSGIFRPEMLLPMGLPETVSVIAWGFSLERPTMIKYGFNNIRDLVGPKIDLEMIQKSPICRLDA